MVSIVMSERRTFRFGVDRAVIGRVTFVRTTKDGAEEDIPTILLYDRHEGDFEEFHPDFALAFHSIEGIASLERCLARLRQEAEEMWGENGAAKISVPTSVKVQELLVKTRGEWTAVEMEVPAPDLPIPTPDSEELEDPEEEP